MHKIRGIAAGLLAATTVTACSLDVGPQDRELRVAELSGEKMVPPVEVTRDGEPSRAVVPFSLEDGRIYYDVLVFNVEDATSATLHIGGPTENTPVAATLFTRSEGAVITGTGTVVQQERLDADELAAGTSYQAVFDAIRGGNAYVVLYTTAFPAGALRGQTLSLSAGAP